MTNTTSCGAVGEEFCALLYGVTSSMIFLICYSCVKGCRTTQTTLNLQARRLEHRLPKTLVSNSNDYDAPCAVCLEEICEDDYICKLSCGHYFHPDCIYQWLYLKNVCPLCKINVIEEP